ncbi:MAG: serine--tRNA ligase, partial [Acidobacteriota bacterium]|nr:serine--tRNA ligase [Acidobacteriota bacterium]
MLDLHFVRENLDAVKTALHNRNFPIESLEKFVELDAERRRVISESDALNQQRNVSSKEIGALMQSGEKDEAERKKWEVADLKIKQGKLEKQRDESENLMRELLAGLPNIPQRDVPVGADESANVEVRSWGTPREFD